LTPDLPNCCHCCYPASNSKNSTRSATKTTDRYFQAMSNELATPKLLVCPADKKRNYATNFTTITSVSANPPLKLIRVDCVWSFMKHGIFTNTLVSYRAPDQ